MRENSSSFGSLSKSSGEILQCLHSKNLHRPSISFKFRCKSSQTSKYFLPCRQWIIVEIVTKQIVELHSSSPQPHSLVVFHYFPFYSFIRAAYLADCPTPTLFRSFSLCGLISSLTINRWRVIFAAFPIFLGIHTHRTKHRKKTSWFHYRFFTALISFLLPSFLRLQQSSLFSLSNKRKFDDFARENVFLYFQAMFQVSSHREKKNKKLNPKLDEKEFLHRFSRFSFTSTNSFAYLATTEIKVKLFSRK